MLFDSGFQKIDYEGLSSGLWDRSDGDGENDDDVKLPPEPSLGNVEYKLKLINPTDVRFERLVSQVSAVLVVTQPLRANRRFKVGVNARLLASLSPS